MRPPLYWTPSGFTLARLRASLSKPGLTANYRPAFGVCTHIGESSATSRNSANQSLRDGWFADSAVLLGWRGTSSSSLKVPHEPASSEFC